MKTIFLVNILFKDLSIFIYLFNLGTVHLDFGPLWGEGVIGLKHWTLPNNYLKKHLFFIFFGGGTLSSLNPGPKGCSILKLSGDWRCLLTIVRGGGKSRQDTRNYLKEEPY